MQRLSKTRTKTGFTLIELMLSMGIMVIVIAVVWGTFLVVNQSHAHVVVVNDVKDFADLQMQAITNILANVDKVKAAPDTSKELKNPDDNGYTRSFYYATNGDLVYYEGTGTQTALDFDQFTFTNSAGVEENKWRVDPTFDVKDTYVTVVLEIYDNASGELYYTLSKSIYVPNVATPALSKGKVLKTHTLTFDLA